MELASHNVTLETLTTEEAAHYLSMLNMARDMPGRGESHPLTELQNYSEGVRLDRPGGFTAFTMGERTVALLHATTPRTHYEIDAIARDPHQRERGIGAQALSLALRQATEDGFTNAGLFTPPRNVDFYQSHGFEVNEDIDDDPNYIRMSRPL